MIERKGISAYCKSDVTTDLFGELTQFRAISSKMVEQVVEQNKWFAFCTKIDDSQINVLTVKNNSGKDLGSFIKDVYEYSGYRTGIYKYLLKEFLCYYEAPTVIKDANAYGYKSSYNKYLITSNIKVVAKWLNITEDEAIAQYGSRLGEVDIDNESDLFQYVKLYETKDHIRKVTRPRKDLDLGISGTRVIPLYALQAGVDLLYKKLEKTTYDVTFRKDSGQERVINTTFNVNKLKEVYADEGFVSDGVQRWYDGDFINNPTLERGYIRVFEVGASIYDNPLRSINYARILYFEEAEPDLSYINVDLDSVISTFTDSLYELNDVKIKDVVEALDLFDVGTTRKINNLEMTSLSDLDTWSEGQLTLLSTVFLRQLALFMIGNPQWFKNYTGEPRVSRGITEPEGQSFEGELDFG